MPAARWLRRVSTSAFVATHFATATAALGWLLAEWISWETKCPGRRLGRVAGLVAITPAFGFVKPMPAMLIGFVAGVVCYLMVTKVKRKFGYDDSLDAFGVHGVGGTLGAILTGVFATNEVNNGLKDSSGNPLPLGLVDGHAGQIVNQLIGTGIAWALAIIGTLAILKVCDVLLGLRVSSGRGGRRTGLGAARRRRLHHGGLKREPRRRSCQPFASPGGHNDEN